MPEELVDGLQNPTAVVGSLVAFAVGLLQPPLVDAVLATVWAQSGTLFTGLSIFAFTMCSELPFLARCGWVETAALVAGAVFLLKLASTVWTNFEARL